MSTAEAGFYKCVSRSLSSEPANIKIDNVELIVKKDWEDVYEHDTEVSAMPSSTEVRVGRYVRYSIMVDVTFRVCVIILLTWASMRLQRCLSPGFRLSIKSTELSSLPE